MSERTERLEFVGGTGARLAGVLHLPSEGSEVHGSVLLAHCFTCGKDIHTMTRLAGGLSEAGYVTLRFDFTGLGQSEGDPEDSTLSVHVKDLARAATALIERGYGPCAMVGHSLGGAATLLAAHRVKTARSVVVIGAPADATHVRHLFAAEEDAIHAEGCVTVDIGGRPFPISDEFVHDLERHTDLDVGGLGRPLLVVHAVHDDVVPVTEGERLFAAARQPKAFVPLLEADHLVTSRRDADQLVHILVDWLGRTR